MYFPYLRGKQFELIALRELMEAKVLGDKIIPVIEPVKPSLAFTRMMDIFIEKKHQFALVLNPSVSDFSILEDETYVKYLSSEYMIHAYLTKPGLVDLKTDNETNLMIINTERDCLDEYLDFQEHNHPDYVLLPDDRTFSRKVVSDSRILFEDRFVKAGKNADYGNKVDEFFSEDHIYYNREGFYGFSDYSVIGSDYQESGFAPAAIAIHIVYFDKERALRIRHFVSDSTKGFQDPAGKFGEALEKLVKWVKDNDIPHTKGLESFIDCYNRKRYPGLGTIKKYSIMHHLELMNRFLEGEI